MANNPYYSERQRQQLLEGRKAQSQQPRQFNVSLDAESKQELRDINSNTLETALTAIDIKEGLASFEEKFKEKFSGFKSKIEEEKEPIAEDLPDFVGPRMVSLSSDNTRNVENDVTVNNNASLEVIEEHAKSIADSVAELLELQRKKKPPEPEPEPVPESEPTVDNKKKKIDDDKKKTKSIESIMKYLKSIKSVVSDMLARFIGYSIEALASFAKWTLLIGSLVFGFDVLSKVIQAWFKDILAGGEKSKNLFGSYFKKIQQIAQSIDKGVDGFDVGELGESLKNLLVKPFILLGSTIKTAIIDGIGSLIYSLGEYTKSDTIRDAGRSMRVTALKEKQASGYEVTPEEYLMIKQQDIADQKSKNTEEFQDQMHNARNSARMYSAMPGYIPPEATELNKVPKQSQADIAASNKRLVEQEKELAEITKDRDALIRQTQKENERIRLEAKKREQAETPATKSSPVPGNSEEAINRASDLINSGNGDPDTVKAIGDIMSSLEEKNNAHKLSESESESYRDLLERYQDMSAKAVPENTSARIDPPQKPVSPVAAAGTGQNVQVNNKTVNTTVAQSVQRTPHKPMVGFANS